jgi:hypothetical protein
VLDWDPLMVREGLLRASGQGYVTLG